MIIANADMVNHLLYSLRCSAQISRVEGGTEFEDIRRGRLEHKS